MTDCPPKLRGDLSKWLWEVDTGVYVGHASSRVRDLLWERVCKHLKNGRATMVYSAGGEQKMDFRVHNSAWQAVDFDGIKLMRRPLPQTQAPDTSLRAGFSKAAQYQMAHKSSVAANRQKKDRYIVIDLETTGLQSASDTIIEYGAIKVEEGVVVDTFESLVQCAVTLPHSIVELTGITDALLQQQGRPPEQALDDFLAFIGKEKLVGYNIAFDMEFLRAACKRLQKQLPGNRCTDILTTARRKVYGVNNYKLATLAKHFSLAEVKHRALEDCKIIQALYGILSA